MYNDNNREALASQGEVDAVEDSQDRALSWLLDMDLSEPEERLFALRQEWQPDNTLSDYELEVARRPMTRGATGADDLENYIREEIVLSSDIQGGDIYSGDADEVVGNGSPGGDSADELMAIDYSRPHTAGTVGGENELAEGVDILGLDENDEIGEKYFVVKRVASAPGARVGDAVSRTVATPAGIAADATSDGFAGTSPPSPESAAPLPDSGSPEPHTMVMDTAENPVAPPTINEAPALRLVGALPAQPAGAVRFEGTAEPEPTAADAAVATNLPDTGAYYLSGERIPDPSSSNAQDCDARLPEGRTSHDGEAVFGELALQHCEQGAADPGADEVLDVMADLQAADPGAGDALDMVADLQANDPGAGDALDMVADLQANESGADDALDMVADLQANDPGAGDALDMVADLQAADPGADDALDTVADLQAADPGADDALDDCAELQATGDEQADVTANIIPLLPQLMDELSLVVNERLASLGRAVGSVQAELMLAGDDATAQRLCSEGFEPAVTLCPTPLVLLQGLRQVEVDAIYLRLVHGSTGDLCNQLFDERGCLPASVVDYYPPAASPEWGGELTVVADADFALFADDTFGTEALDDLSPGSWQPDAADIDDIFADFGDMGAVERDDALLAETAADVFSGRELADSADGFPENLLAEESEPGMEAVSSQDEIDALFESLDIGDSELTAVEETQPREAFSAGAHLHLVAQAPVTTVAEPRASAGNDISFVPAGITFSQASPGGGEIFSDFLEAFIEEGSSELEKLEDAVLLWEKDVTSEAAFAVVSRTLHTLKGIAKGVGLQFYGTLIHNFETLLGALPRPVVGEEGDYFRIVNAWLDACVRGLEYIEDARADITCELPQSTAGEAVSESPAPVLDRSDAVFEQEPAPATRPEQAGVEARANEASNKIADDGARVLAAQQSVRITSEKLDHLLNLSNQAQQLSVRTAQSVTRSKRASTEMQSKLASVRAHIAAIADRALRSVAAQGVQPGAPMDALEMDQYSELQEAANILREGVEDLADLVDFATRQNIQVEALLKQQTKVISSIGTSIRGARVVPVSRLVPGLRRLVRTLSVDLDKAVSFRVLNELGTLDRDDYARCQTILDHMVRNALDHGIENAAERTAAGKPADGLVTIDIRKAGADAVITLTDDGRGIDPAKLRESAVKKGLNVDVDALTDAEALRLIFHKGFSTANSVSQISGRGVGMDIVLSELQEMGGDIQIDSVPGRGTSFHIRVPSSITVNGALLVSAGQQSYAIPLGGLIAVEQVPVEEFFAAVQHNSRLSLAGMQCEPAYLATLCQSGHSLDAKTWQHSVPVIIAGSPERYMAIAVDDVEEALELVIRSLGTQFSTVPGVAGAATTAAGEAIVALDLNLLVASVGANDEAGLRVDAEREEGLLVLVVDDSRTQRMVATSQLETAGVDTLTAENGVVAIDLLNAADRLPDIILMDVEMPAKDGIQTLREIRKSVRYGHLPVIMITSRTGLKHRAMAQAAGCNGYMGKPFNFRMLIGQINQLTGHRLQLS